MALPPLIVQMRNTQQFHKGGPGGGEEKKKQTPNPAPTPENRSLPDLAAGKPATGVEMELSPLRQAQAVSNPKVFRFKPPHDRQLQEQETTGGFCIITIVKK